MVNLNLELLALYLLTKNHNYGQSELGASRSVSLGTKILIMVNLSSELRVLCLLKQKSCGQCPPLVVIWRSELGVFRSLPVKTRTRPSQNRACVGILHTHHEFV